jgi:1-phosphofructokinase
MVGEAWDRGQNRQQGVNSMNIITVTLNPAVDLTVTVDNLKKNEIHIVRSLRKDSGGKGINVSKVLHNLGFRTIATGFIGGPSGTWIQTDLQSQNIKTDFIVLPQETRTNIKIIDSDSETQLNGAGPTLTEADIQSLEEKLQQLVQDGDAVVFAGSVPQQTDPGIYSRLIRSLQNRNVFIAVDTSGPALAEAIRMKPNVIKPNEEELGQLFHTKLETEQDILQYARRLLADGIDIILVSRGRLGSLLVTHSGVYKAVPPAIETKSTIGAGDSTVAGFVAHYLMTGDLEASFVFANACGVATAQRSGSQVCTKEDIKRFLNQISCKRL